MTSRGTGRCFYQWRRAFPNKTGRCHRRFRSPGQRAPSELLGSTAVRTSSYGTNTTNFRVPTPLQCWSVDAYTHTHSNIQVHEYTSMCVLRFRCDKTRRQSSFLGVNTDTTVANTRPCACAKHAWSFCALYLTLSVCAPSYPLKVDLSKHDPGRRSITHYFLLYSIL